MIKLKDKINKSVALRTIRRDAEGIYRESWEPELQIEAYVAGAEAILNYLHLPRVVVSEAEGCFECKHLFSKTGYCNGNSADCGKYEKQP